MEDGEVWVKCLRRRYVPRTDTSTRSDPSPHLLLLPLSGRVAPLDLPVAEEVAEVAEDGEDAVAHVGEHRHQQGRLLVGLDEGPPVQAAGSGLKEDRKSEKKDDADIPSSCILYF